MGFPAQCAITTGIAAIAILTAGIIDHSLVLPGRDVGLLEHPGIWAFLGLQFALPLIVRRSLFQLLRFRRIARVMGPDSGTKITESVLRFTRLKSTGGQLIASTAYLVGLIAFVWNTYQNQLPGVVVSFDFWDSATHPWGFWTTRVYKLYLFVWLLPYVALLHAAVLWAVLEAVRRARLSAGLTLDPFHQDGVGGLGVVPGLITTPIIVTLLISSFPVASAIEVHRAADITPLMGICVVALSLVLAYFVPTLRLRTDIVAMKRDLVERLRRLQRGYYRPVIDDPSVDFETLRRGNEAMDYLDKVSLRVRAISNYPHLKRLLRFLGLALTPSVVTVGLQVAVNAIAVIKSMLVPS